MIQEGLKGMVLEGVCYWNYTLRFQSSSKLTGVLFLLLADLDVELSATTLAPYLLACCQAFNHDDNELKL